MAQAKLLQNDFSRGVKRDFPITAMPQGTVWRSVDFLPQEDAPLKTRGGAVTAAVLSTQSGAFYPPVAGIYAPFSGGAQNLTIDSAGQLFSFTGTGAAPAVSAVTYIGGSQAPIQNPVFHNDLVLIPNSAGVGGIIKYDGTNINSLSASSPTATYLAVWKDYTVAAGSAAIPDRVWFSAPGDPTETWATDSDYQDFTYPVRGLAALRNVILVFHDSTTSRMRGSIPPADGDMVTDDPAFQVGCIDARSIATWNESVIWCGTDGVYVSDGISFTDLTQRGGMVSYWRDELFRNYQADWVVSGGVYRNYYFISVVDESSQVSKGFWTIDLTTGAWYEHSGLTARSFWNAQATIDELYSGSFEPYAGSAGTGTDVHAFSTLWDETVTTDFRGTAIGADNGGAILETPYYLGKPGYKRWRRGYVNYSLTDPTSANPTLGVGFSVEPTYTLPFDIDQSLAESWNGVDPTLKRGRFDIDRRAQGVRLQLKPSGGVCRIYSIEAEVEALDSTRLQ